MATTKKRSRLHRNCRACRERHTKCDDRASACRYCIWNKIECVRNVDVRFRNTLEKEINKFPDNQTWLPQSTEIRYHDETSRTAEICTQSDSIKQHEPEAISNYTDSSDYPRDARMYNAGEGISVEDNDMTPQTQASSSKTYLGNPVLEACNDEVFPFQRSEGLVLPRSTRFPNALTNYDNATQATNTVHFTQREAELLRNFSENMALWADVTDYERNFEYEVPRRAIHSPVLRFAILAFSSRHMNRFCRNTSPEALQYYNKCLELLIPVLSEGDKEMTQDILAAVGILRMDEEMEDFDTECHLKGAIRILNQTPLLCTRGGLGEAAALLCLRQDMYISLIHHQPLRIRPAIFESCASLNRIDDLGWTNRMILLLARILSVVYSISEDKGHELLILHDEVDGWMQGKPDTFDPILNLPRDKKCNRRLPVLWMLSPTQVIGLQYYHIAKLVLTATATQQIQDSRSSFQRSKGVEKRVRKHLLAIIGLASSNPKAENALFMARHMLLVWGGVLTDDSDHAAIEQFLRDMERRTGWSVTRLIAELAEQWNSSDNEDG